VLGLFDVNLHHFVNEFGFLQRQFQCIAIHETIRLSILVGLGTFEHPHTVGVILSVGVE